jgi:hypothetical protein
MATSNERGSSAPPNMRTSAAYAYSCGEACGSHLSKDRLHQSSGTAEEALIAYWHIASVNAVPLHVQPEVTGT